MKKGQTQKKSNCRIKPIQKEGTNNSSATLFDYVLFVYSYGRMPTDEEVRASGLTPLSKSKEIKIP